MTPMLLKLPILSAIYFLMCLNCPVSAACVDVGTSDIVSFEGLLSYRIFAGPPNFEDVRKGDTPEPGYVVKLDEAICAAGDEFIDASTYFDQIQIFPDDSAPAPQELLSDLRRLVGQRVLVEGKSAFGAHTGHHHAPLVMPIISITIASDPTSSYGTALTTVQAFYLALGAGNGDEAARLVIPQKRSSGPLSAAAITGFYGKLIEPLTVIDIRPVHPDEYRVRYRYVAAGPRRCEGTALVRTVKINGRNLIAAIRALNGC